MRLQFTAFCLLWLASLTLSYADESKIFCNYQSSAITRVGYARMDPSEIDSSLCTHLIYSFVGMTENGNIHVLDPWDEESDQEDSPGFEEFNALREQNERIKTLVSGGDTALGYENYLRVIADTSLRSEYVKNVVDFVLRHKFDGFDVFWQSTNIPAVVPDVMENLVLLLKELRARFDEHELILSITVHGVEQYASSYYDIPEVSKYVDFILLGIRCHDPRNPTAGHSAPLYPASRETSTLDLTLNINASVHYWLAQGAPAEKLILGTRFQGMGYILKNSGEHGPGSPVSGPARSDLGQGFSSYHEICERISQDRWTTVWDEEQRVPYAYAGDEWISYDNVRSLKEKARYVRSLGLGGVMALYLNMDDRRGECGGRFPLLNALNRGLREIGSSSVLEPDDDLSSEDDLIKSPDQKAKRICAKFNLKYVRDPQNCAKFWICQKIDENEFRAEPFSCGHDLYFDTIHKICNTKNSVQCC